MVHELSGKLDNKASENYSLNKTLNVEITGDNIWPCCKAEADSRRSLLNRFTAQDRGNSQLPALVDLQLDGSKPEKVTANSSRLQLNSDNTISKLTRKDGSAVNISYENGEKKQVIDCNKDETVRTVWTQNRKGLWESNSQIKDKDGRWISDGKPARQYRDVCVTEQGVTIATDLVGFMHVTIVDGTKLKEGARYTFDQKGRIDSISYLPCENRQLKFHYDANDKLDRVEIRDGEGKLQQTRIKTGEGQWQIKNRDGSSGGMFQGEMELTQDGLFRQQDSKDKAAGQWQVISPFDKYAEKSSADGKHVSRIYADRIEESDKTAGGEELIRKIIRGKESREFHYDSDGLLLQLVDTTAGGSQLLKTDGLDVRISPTGEVTVKKPDGSKVIKRTDFSTEEQDKDGDIQKVISKDGRTRAFEYETINNRKEVVKITDSRPGTKGPASEVWLAKKNSDGSLSGQFVSSGPGVKEQVVSGVRVLYNGDYQFKGADGKDRIARMSGDLSSRVGGFSAGVDEARERLKAALGRLLDAGRNTRLEGLMKDMEKRAQDAIERQTAAGKSQDKVTEDWQKKIAKTYDYLADMLEQNPTTAVYNQATRAKLVENFLWICADTTRGAQDVGNCWQMSGRNLTGMQNNPDSMARILKEVSLTGTFTSVRGGIKSKDSLDRRKGDINTPKKFTLPKNMLQLDKVNAGWSLDKPTDSYWQGGIGIMPSTPVGYILDNAIGYMGGRKSHRALEGGLWESFNSPSGNTREGWYYGINELMYMATGERTTKPIRVSSNDITSGDISNLTDKRLQKQLLEHGGALLVGPGHMFAVKLIKNRGEWQIVTDNQWGAGGDQIIGKVTDLRNWTVQRTRVKYRSESNPAYRENL